MAWARAASIVTRTHSDADVWTFIDVMCVFSCFYLNYNSRNGIDKLRLKIFSLETSISNQIFTKKMDGKSENKHWLYTINKFSSIELYVSLE